MEAEAGGPRQKRSSVSAIGRTRIGQQALHRTPEPDAYRPAASPGSPEPDETPPAPLDLARPASTPEALACSSAGHHLPDAGDDTEPGSRLAEVHDPGEALTIIDRLDLAGYHPFHATRADVLRRLDRTAGGARSI